MTRQGDQLQFAALREEAVVEDVSLRAARDVNQTLVASD